MFRPLVMPPRPQTCGCDDASIFGSKARRRSPLQPGGRTHTALRMRWSTAAHVASRADSPFFPAASSQAAPTPPQPAPGCVAHKHTHTHTHTQRVPPRGGRGGTGGPQPAHARGARFSPRDALAMPTHNLAVAHAPPSAPRATVPCLAPQLKLHASGAPHGPRAATPRHAPSTPPIRPRLTPMRPLILPPKLCQHAARRAPVHGESTPSAGGPSVIRQPLPVHGGAM